MPGRYDRQQPTFLFILSFDLVFGRKLRFIAPAEVSLGLQATPPRCANTKCEIMKQKPLAFSPE